MNTKNKNVFSDYESFLKMSSETPPLNIQSSLFKTVSQDLNPPFSKLSLKFGVLQTVGIFFSLLVCPQFGFGPLGGEQGLMAFYMLAGSYACAVFCGATFLCFSSLLSSLLLTIDETRKIIKTKIFITPFLFSIIFALAMVIKGQETLTYALLWALGCGVSYYVFMKLGNLLRIKIYKFTIH
jgi:small basic protein